MGVVVVVGGEGVGGIGALKTCSRVEGPKVVSYSRVGL